MDYHNPYTKCRTSLCLHSHTTISSGSFSQFKVILTAELLLESPYMHPNTQECSLIWYHNCKLPKHFHISTDWTIQSCVLVISLSPRSIPTCAHLNLELWWALPVVCVINNPCAPPSSTAHPITANICRVATAVTTSAVTRGCPSGCGLALLEDIIPGGELRLLTSHFYRLAFLCQTPAGSRYLGAWYQGFRTSIST